MTLSGDGIEEPLKPVEELLSPCVTSVREPVGEVVDSVVPAGQCCGATEPWALEAFVSGSSLG